MAAFTSQQCDKPFLSCPSVSYNALKRSRSTLEDFMRSYFMFHNLNIIDGMFTHLSLLVFVEATIYQVLPASLLLNSHHLAYLG
jgi:hypothetical protein